MEHQKLTVEQTAHLLNIGTETVQEWLNRGLPAERGHQDEVLIDRADLDAFLQREGQGHPRDAATEH